MWSIRYSVRYGEYTFLKNGIFVFATTIYSSARSFAESLGLSLTSCQLWLDER